VIILPTEKRFDWQHAPVVLFGIILLNILVFALYQSGDNRKVGEAIQAYAEGEFLELEWPVYAEYLAREGESERRSELESAFENGYYQPVAVQLLFDREFFPYLSREIRSQLPDQDYRTWLRERERIQTQVESISSLALGLVPNELQVLDVFTHQFLHGGLMHLVGNLVFLAICGFAVEAAIGHGRFLLFYLLSGAAGGLAHAALNLDSPQPLVGASGAISGVMAMYLAVFRFKRIEFFYWLFFLVGYIRAPALLILPFYIGKELYSYHTNVDSNVAFMAHTGGFLAGAVLIGSAWLLNRNLFNTEYIEADQSVDPRREKLAGIYDAIAQCQFKTALTRLNRMIKEDGLDFELAALRYNLLKPRGGKSRLQAAWTLVRMDRLMPSELDKVAEVCRDNPKLLPAIPGEERIKLGMRLLTGQQVETAESIFLQLREAGLNSHALGVFARKLSMAYETLSQPEKHTQYARLADELMEAY